MGVFDIKVDNGKAVLTRKPRKDKAQARAEAKAVKVQEAGVTDTADDADDTASKGQKAEAKAGKAAEKK
jgi:hypothetical protein